MAARYMKPKVPPKKKTMAGHMGDPTLIKKKIP
jgi:hypothetical protein